MVRKLSEQFDKQKELDNCTFVKTVLMLLVVFYHCIVFWTGEWFARAPVQESKILAVVASWMNSFHIYGFALISGYLFYYLKYEKEKYGQYIPFLKQKAKRLLMPFVFMVIVWVIPVNYLFFPFSLRTFVSKFILGTAPGQLWFLLMLFGVFAIFYPLSGFMKKRQILGIILVLGIYGFGLVGQALLPNIFQIFTACMYIPVFWLGFKLRQWGTDWLRKIPAWVWLLAHVLLFVLIWYISGMGGVFLKMLRIGFAFVLHVVGALMAFTILQKLANKVHWKESKVFGFLSKTSMPVYNTSAGDICFDLFLKRRFEPVCA